MQQHKNSLFEAFHADHATLGRGFHELSQCLRSGDLASAKQIVERIDSQAGAHIAFEEEHFYGALRPLLGDDEVQKMFREHERGLEVLQAVRQSSTTDPARRAQMLQQSESMESHIAECGELFAAMGRIPPEDQATLYQHLLRWRELQPRWSGYAATRKAGRQT